MSADEYAGRVPTPRCDLLVHPRDRRRGILHIRWEGRLWAEPIARHHHGDSRLRKGPRDLLRRFVLLASPRHPSAMEPDERRKALHPRRQIEIEPAPLL